MRAFPILALVGCSAVVACASESARPDLAILPPNPVPAQGGELPDVGSLPLAGQFTFTGPTALGSASVDMAPVLPFDELPMSFGGGSFDVTVDGVNFASDTGDSVATVLPASLLGADFAHFGVYLDEDASQLGTDVQVLVPAGDVVAGTTVALDGVERVAVFFHGDLSQPEPEIAAAAVVGTVTFTAGSVEDGATLTASVAGQFGPITFDDIEPGSLEPGDYLLAFLSPAIVYCDGSLVGQESAFAGVSLAQLGFGSGVVTIESVTATEVSVAGAPIQAGFGKSPLVLGGSPDVPPGVVYAEVGLIGSGPASTDKLGHYLALDSAGAGEGLAYGGAGAAYATASHDGYCAVSYGVSLTSI